MSRDKLIIVGVIVLGLLGFLVYKQSEKDRAIGQAVTVPATDFPKVGVSDDVDKISLTNGDKGEVVLEKVPDPKGASGPDGGAATTWVVTKPFKAPANQQTVKDILANLKDMKVESEVELKLSDDVRKDKQLDAAHAVHVVVSKDGQTKVDELFGKSGPAGQLVIVSDKPDQVWAAKGYSSYLYTKDAKEYRNKELFKFDDNNVSQVTIVNSTGTLSFTKGDKWVGTHDKTPIPSFSDDKVKEMLRHYKALTADDFGDGKTLAETGLDKPDATISIVLKDGAGKYDLLVGKTSTGTNHWAKRGDDDAIVQISNFSAEWATSGASKYTVTASPDAGAPADGGTKVSDSGQKASPRFKK